MKLLFKFLLLTLIHVNVFAQTPEKMSYQAIVRDNTDVLLKNSNVDLKIIVRQGSPKGSSVYEETHYTKTNKNGLISLEIGSGTIEKGLFSEISWAEGPFFIETLIDPEGKSNYSINGISQMLSVPYALHAKSADSFTGTISPSQMPDYYTADEVDAIFENITTLEGVAQSLKLTKSSLGNSGGLMAFFENWDTNVKDDFSGKYDDLQDKPELYYKTEIDNLIKDIQTSGIPQNLSLEESTLSISGGNSISFVNWDTDAGDDFSGIYEDLQNKPELYNKAEIDGLIDGIKTTGGVPQNLRLEQSTLSLSSGNSISFDNWDTNAGDDFSGIYEDLQNKPELYNKAEIDGLIDGIETTGGIPQNLSLEQSTLSISGGNSISFDHWDTNGNDDFSGIYDDLKNKPELYDKTEIDNLIEGIETNGGVSQNLNLDQTTLSISKGNSISFENWDTNVDDDFDGKYSSLTGAPKVYSQEEVDNIKAEIMQEVAEDYSKKASVSSLSSNRSVNINDVGNTIACTSSATLSITSGFSSMEVGEVINLETHGTTLKVKGASGVVINGKSGGNISIGNNEVYTGGIIRKTGINSYIVL